MSAHDSALAIGAASLLMLACGAAQPEPSTSLASTTASSRVSATASSAAEPPHQPSAAIVELWRARCNQCHVRVEPGTRERATLRPALERHRKRARLSESDIDELFDYLAK